MTIQAPGRLLKDALKMVLAGTLLLAPLAEATTRLTLKSGKASSSYYVMMVQLSEVIKTASNDRILPTVEESQGSVQNVRESLVRPGNFLFTSPPSLLADARENKPPFERRGGDNARALFVMPFITVHFVVAAKTGITDVEELAGTTLIPGGKGSFCERRSNEILQALALNDKVKTVLVETSTVVSALRNNKVDGFINCASHPTPQISELANTSSIRLLSLTASQRKKVLAVDPRSGPITISAGTYKGQEQDIHTVGTPVGAFGTVAMDNETAYFITKTFWEWKDRLAAENSWWQGITPELMTQMAVPVHPGALKYYDEAGITIPAEMRQ